MWQVGGGERKRKRMNDLLLLPIEFYQIQSPLIAQIFVHGDSLKDHLVGF